MYEVKRFTSLDDAEKYVKSLGEEATDLSFVSHGLIFVVAHYVPPPTSSEELLQPIGAPVPVADPVNAALPAKPVVSTTLDSPNGAQPTFVSSSPTPDYSIPVAPVPETISGEPVTSVPITPDPVVPEKVAPVPVETFEPAPVIEEPVAEPAPAPVTDLPSQY